MDISKHRNTAIWFEDGTSTWPFFTDQSHDEIRIKMETELFPGKKVLQIQDIPERRRGGRGNQHKCEGAMDFKDNIDYITTNFLPTYWTSLIKPKGVPYREYQKRIADMISK